QSLLVLRDPALQILSRLLEPCIGEELNMVRQCDHERSSSCQRCYACFAPPGNAGHRVRRKKSVRVAHAPVTSTWLGISLGKQRAQLALEDFAGCGSGQIGLGHPKGRWNLELCQ